MRPDHLVGIAAARARADVPTPAGTREAVEAVTEHTVPGRAQPVRVRVYHPARQPVGVVLYLHGGGHVTGTVDSYDGLTRRLANRVPATVVSVDYRRAPEHRCPAAVDDAQAAYEWALRYARSLAPRGPGQLVIAGDSAGGNNAAVLTRRLRDGPGVPPVLQVLLYPPLDAVAYRDPDAYPSYRACGDGLGLVYADGLFYWDAYLGPDGDPGHPDASPLRLPDLSGLAPAYVLTVEYDVLRDEGAHYAARLEDAGVPVIHRRWNGHLHGFLGDPSTYDDADPALDEVATAVRTALTGRVP